MGERPPIERDAPPTRAREAFTLVERGPRLARMAGPNVVHLLAPPRRARVLAEFSVTERRLLSAVCCSRRSLAVAARELELTSEEAARLLQRIAAALAAALAQPASAAAEDVARSPE